MAQGKQLDFSGSIIFVGIDVHLKHWTINLHDGDFELRQFQQDPDAMVLLKYLNRNFPGAQYKLAYEAGFCGFGIHRFFARHGIECLVFNAADVATTHKEKQRKNDKIDARKIREHLQTPKAQGVFVPSEDWEHARSLVRVRSRLVMNQSRIKSQIWHLLYSSGIQLSDEMCGSRYWSKRFLKQIEELAEKQDENLKSSILCYLEYYHGVRKVILGTTRLIRELCKNPKYEDQITLVRSIPGIGEVNAAVILFETMGMERFKSFDAFCSYAGLVPDTGDSGDTIVNKGITSRANNFLRKALIESSWVVIRKDPALLMKYKHYVSHMHKNKAIVRIAKHLLSRIRYVLKHQTKYEIGIVA